MQATVNLYSAAGVLIADLANAYGVSWQDVINEAGTGEFSLPYDDPQGVQIVPGSQVYCYLDGLHVFTWVVREPPEITSVSDAEESGQEWRVTGVGKAQRLEEARIYSWRGTAPQVMAQHRIYSFASPDYPNLGTWINATEIAPQSFIDPVRRAILEYITVSDIADIPDAVDFVFAAAPLGWLIPSAIWIWGQADTSDIGFNYFRGTFYLPIETAVVIAATADNYWTLYLDGAPILGDQGEGIGWLEHKRVDLRLKAGVYNLAAVVENIFVEGLTREQNPAAFLCAVFTVDDNDKVMTIIATSDDSWVSLAYPVSTPGWTPGQMIIDAINEAQARGALVGFTVDFTGTLDSGGHTWVGSGGAGTYVPGYSAPIGSTIFDVLGDLVALGWVDFRYDAASDKLQMWSKGTGAVTTAIDFVVNGDTDTQNLVTVEYAPHHPVTTVMFVKWSAGFLEVVNAAAEALYGRIEGFLTVDAGADVVEATRLANLALAEVDNVEYAIVAHVDPIRPLVDQPYLNFVPGDFVNILNQFGAMTATKVFSISVAANDLGRATLVLELNNRRPSPERDLFDLTVALGRGVVGSTIVRNAKATTSTTANK